MDINEINKFIETNPIRNNFLPIMKHLEILKVKNYNIYEYEDINKKTSSICFNIKTPKFLIDGRVSFDWIADIKPEYKDNIIFEFWWDDECYSLKHTILEAKNMLTILIQPSDKLFRGYPTYKDFRNAQKTTLLPIYELQRNFRIR